MTTEYGISTSHDLADADIFAVSSKESAEYIATGHPDLAVVQRTITDWAEVTAPGSYYHPRDKRRTEALTLLSAYFKADEYGEPDDAEYAAGSVMSFVQKLFGITSAEIDREMKS